MPYSKQSFASRFVDDSSSSKMARQDERLKQLEADAANIDLMPRSDAGLGSVLEHWHPFMPWINKDGTWGCGAGSLDTVINTVALASNASIGTGTYLCVIVTINTATGGIILADTGFSVASDATAENILVYGVETPTDDDRVQIPLAKYVSATKTVTPRYCYRDIVIPLQKYIETDTEATTGSAGDPAHTHPWGNASGYYIGALSLAVKYRIAYCTEAYRLELPAAP
jgi:hypothetical protein